MIEDPRSLVRALLAAARITPPEAEVEQMIAGYPTLRTAADSLYFDEVAGFAPAFLASDDDGPDEADGLGGGEVAGRAMATRGGER